MITGFNTDVQHEGHVYHVQTEDCGRDNPVFESIIYIGGTVVAKKRTPYADKLTAGASEETIASLLKKQHQVIIAAIKAGRIKDLIKLSAKEQNGEKKAAASPSPEQGPPQNPARVPEVTPLSAPPERPAVPLSGEQRAVASSETLPSSEKPIKRGETRSLDLDQVLADYQKKNQGQARLDIKVLSPDVFIAGRSIGLRVLVTNEGQAVAEAPVTVKVIGTAFKPQVYTGRAGRDGVANFSLALPSFNAGTAAIVIESQGKQGRGELKHLIRRA